jgi:hypothetical protein
MRRVGCSIVTSSRDIPGLACARRSTATAWKGLESLGYYHTSAKKKLRGIGKLLDLELSIAPDDFEFAEAKKLSRRRPAME